MKYPAVSFRPGLSAPMTAHAKLSSGTVPHRYFPADLEIIATGAENWYIELSYAKQ
jgi:hypothetical protein